VRVDARWWAGFVAKGALFAGLTLYLSATSMASHLPVWVKHQLYGEWGIEARREGG
jgi:hypothetical protein